MISQHAAMRSMLVRILTLTALAMVVASCSGVQSGRPAVPPGAQTITVAPPDMVADRDDP